jgi:hypothetical protein
MTLELLSTIDLEKELLKIYILRWTFLLHGRARQHGMDGFLTCPQMELEFASKFPFDSLNPK